MGGEEKNIYSCNDTCGTNTKTLVTTLEIMPYFAPVAFVFLLADNCTGKGLKRFLTALKWLIMTLEIYYNYRLTYFHYWNT